VGEMKVVERAGTGIGLGALEGGNELAAVVAGRLLEPHEIAKSRAMNAIEPSPSLCRLADVTTSTEGTPLMALEVPMGSCS